MFVCNDPHSRPAAVISELADGRSPDSLTDGLHATAKMHHCAHATRTLIATRLKFHTVTFRKLITTPYDLKQCVGC